MENTTGQKSHSINYEPGQQRYFSLGISPSQSPGYTMCKKQKSQTKRKSAGFLSWLRKGIFFQNWGKETSNASGRPTAIRPMWALRPGDENKQPLMCRGHRGSSLHLHSFGRNYQSRTQLPLLLEAFWDHLIAVKEIIGTPGSITWTADWSWPLLQHGAEPPGPESLHSGKSTGL